MSRTAQVFEYGCLAVGQQGFLQRHFDGLVRYRERCRQDIYSAGHQRLHFGSYVGVIQIGDLTIEILPKAERDATADKGKWQRALIEMLHAAGVVDVATVRDANLRLHRSPLINIYLDAFLSETDRLVHEGLARKYRVTEGNLFKLKGRLLFRQQISRNLLHKERVYSAHQTYDRDNLFNHVLKRALNIVEAVANRPALGARARVAGLSFEGLTDVHITSSTFDHIRFDRHTERYRHALQLARLIIMNFSPDVRGGSEHVLSLLFDMNELFERFVLVKMQRAEVRYAHCGLKVRGQESRLFWGGKSIRPDIVVCWKGIEGEEKIILDTKWKVPRENRPADTDLKQMFAYNVHFGARHCVLVYPKVGDPADVTNGFIRSQAFVEPYDHSCRMHFVDLFDEHQRLRADLGQRIIEAVVFAHRSGGGITE